MATSKKTSKKTAKKRSISLQPFARRAKTMRAKPYGPSAGPRIKAPTYVDVKWPAKMQESFMQPQVVHGSFYIVDTTYGIEAIPYDVIGPSATKAKFKDFIEGKYIDHEIETGYGARLSAPGYMDSTPWTIYKSKAEAVRALKAEFDGRDDDDDYGDDY